jgi:hypothetical protein
MISEKNYKRMATEVLEIINLYPEDTRDKIPSKLIEELEKNRLSNLKVTLDKDKKLYEQDVCDETLVMMYMIYRNYIAAPEEKARFDEMLEKFDKQTREQYDPAKLFEKPVKKQEPNSSASHQDRE